GGAALLYELQHCEIKGDLNLLRNQSNASGQLARLVVLEMALPKQDFATGGQQKRAEDFQQSGLASSIRSNDSDCIALADIKAQPLQHRFLYVRVGEFADAQKLAHITYSRFARRRR